MSYSTRSLLPPSARRRLKSSLTHLPHPLRSGYGRVVVLCYHSVHPSKEFSSATPELFADQIAWLKDNCRLVSFSDVLKQARGSHKHEQPVVAVTFDDGYADNYGFAFPVLNAYGVTATFFLTIGLIEQEPHVVERFRQQRACSYEEVQPLTWDQILHMREEGMEFGTHTWSHPNLARLDDDRATMELARSKQVLERRLGETVTVCAYPYGKPHRHFTPRTMRIAAATGYTYAASATSRGLRPADETYAIPRFISNRDSPEQLESKILGSLDLLGTWQERAPMWLAGMVSPEDFRY